MKTYFIFIIAMVTFLIGHHNVKAQEGWQVGIQGSSFYYWMYNKHDFNDPIDPPGKGSDYVTNKPLELFSPNGWLSGVNVSYVFSGRLGLGMNVNYSTHKQEMIYKPLPSLPFDLSRYELVVYDKLSYLYLPIFGEYRIGHEEGWQSFFQLGCSYSLLVKSSYFHHSISYDFFGNYFREGLTEVNNRNFHYTYMEDTGYKSISKGTLTSHYLRQHLFGLYGQIGVHFPLSDHFKLRIGIWGNYDLSNPEKLSTDNSIVRLKNVEIIEGSYEPMYYYRHTNRWTQHYEIIEDEFGPNYGPLIPRPRSRNIRAGLMLSLVYDLDGY